MTQVAILMIVCTVRDCVVSDQGPFLFDALEHNGLVASAICVDGATRDPLQSSDM